MGAGLMTRPKKTRREITDNWKRFRTLEKELEHKDIALPRVHEIMYELIEMYRSEEYPQGRIELCRRLDAFKAFKELRNMMTVDIATKLFVPEDKISRHETNKFIRYTDRPFKLVLWEVCCESDFRMGREYLLNRFESNKAMYPPFARWYDKKYNLDIKLKDMPTSMGIDLLGWRK
jgi:hypothetical protein